MATIFDVHGSPLTALRSALNRAGREGRSMTVYTPQAREAPYMYLVGPSSKATDMAAAGAMPLFSVQNHVSSVNGGAVPKDECDCNCPHTVGESMRCWADLEEEVDRAP